MPLPADLGLDLNTYNMLFGFAGLICGGLFIYGILAAFN